MPRTTGFLGSRHGWQRHPAVGIASLATILLACAACGARPSQLFQDADSLRRADRIEDAIRLADRGLASSNGRPEWLHRFRILKAELLVMQGAAQQALDLVETREGAPVPETPEIKAGYLFVRGYALSQMRHGAAAQPLLEQARAIAAGAKLVPLESTVLVRLGTVLYFLNHTDRAEECYRSALALADRAGDTYLQARAQESLGYLDLNTFHYDECAIWSARALHTYQSLGAEIRTATVSHNLGWCDYRLGNDEEAQTLFSTAERLFTKHSQWGALAINLNSLGNAAMARGDSPAARSFYERVVALAGKTGDTETLAFGRGNLATTLILLGDLNSAEAVNRQAEAIPADRVSQETRLRVKLNSGRIEAARGHLPQAEAICRDVANSGIRQPKLLIDANVLLAEVLDREKRPQEAETALQTALAELDNSRSELLRDESKLTYSAGLIDIFRQYVDLLCRQNRPLDALKIAESSRARLLAEQSKVSRASLDPDAFREFARNTGTVFLFYWIAPARSHVWAITSSGITHEVLPPAAEIRSLVDSYQKFIDDFGDPLSTANPGRDLFAALVGPVQQHLPKGSHVVIVPDGPLFDINFESLPAPAGGPHYWLRDVTVSVAPALGLLLRPADRGPSQTPHLLLIGDALSADPKAYPRLANAGKEIDRIAAQFPAEASFRRTGPDATPDAYARANLADFSLIHFAAHAAANRESPLDSAVILSPHEGGYKLYAREIRSRPIHAELVTISACRSAGARTYAGEGLVGFAWAFLGAGARNVVAGLWEADDRSTAQLMERMYKELRGGAPPADALRQAKLQLADSDTSFRKPYYWAPFQLFTASLQ